MYILNEVCYLTTSNGGIYFFCGSTWNDPYVEDTVVYFTILAATIHIIASGLWLIREKLNDMFIWGKPLKTCSFKGVYLFHRSSCSNICLSSAVLNARKYLKPPHCLLVNVLICNFNSNCSYSLSVVNFLEEQLQTLHLQGWLSEQLLSLKNWYFRVLIALIFFCGTIDVKRNYVKRIYLKHQIFVIFCLILMRIFQNSPKKLHVNSGSEKIASPRFHAVSSVCK